MLRIAICDDETAERERIKELMGDYLKERPQLGACLSLFAGGYGLLDVIMPDCDGIQVGKKLRQMGRDGAIIYLTTSPDYAVESYTAHAFFYLLKPVKKERLFNVLDRAVAEIQKQKSEATIVNTPSGMRSIPLDEILYVERVERFMRYYLAGGETVDSRTIRSSFRAGVAALLADHRFSRCGASFVLNLCHVKEVEKGEALLDSGGRVPLSRAAYGEVKRAWMDYWLGDNYTGS